jgi:hypothetical protein
MDAKNTQTRAGRACGEAKSFTKLPVTKDARKRSLYTIKMNTKNKKPKHLKPESPHRPAQGPR